MTSVEDVEAEVEGSVSSEESEVGLLGELRLSPLESKLAQLVLHDTVTQLDMFTGGVHPFQALPSSDMKERFVKPIKYKMFDPETSDKIETSLEMRSKLKLQKDKSMLIKLLCNMRDELEARGSYGMAGNLMRHEEKKESLERELEQEYWARKGKVYHMKRLLADTRRHRRRLDKDKTAMAEALLDQLQEVSQTCATEFQYVKKYESVRAEQNYLVCKKQERELRKSMSEISEDTVDEDRIHEATIIYLEYAIKRLEDKIDYWTRRYNDDIDFKDIEIANLKQRRSEGADLLQEIHDQYKEREEEINQFLGVLEERQRLEEERLHKERMAVRIQAWWRGTMVRAQLGPFSSMVKDKKKKKHKK